MKARSKIFLGLSLIASLSACSNSPPTRSAAESARDHYCEGNHAIQNLSFSIRVPKPELKGCSPEKEGKLRRAISEGLRQYLREDLISDILIGYDFHERPSCRLLRKEEIKNQCLTNSSWPYGIDGRSYYLNFADRIREERMEDLYKWYEFIPSYRSQSAPNIDYCGVVTDSQWHSFTYSETKFQESPQNDGSTVFTITLNMDPFCKYGILQEGIVPR